MGFRNWSEGVLCEQVRVEEVLLVHARLSTASFLASLQHPFLLSGSGERSLPHQQALAAYLALLIALWIWNTLNSRMTSDQGLSLQEVQQKTELGLDRWSGHRVWLPSLASRGVRGKLSMPLGPNFIALCRVACNVQCSTLNVEGHSKRKN